MHHRNSNSFERDQSQTLFLNTSNKYSSSSFSSFSSFSSSFSSSYSWTDGGYHVGRKCWFSLLFDISKAAAICIPEPAFNSISLFQLLHHCLFNGLISIAATLLAALYVIDMLSHRFCIFTFLSVLFVMNFSWQILARWNPFKDGLWISLSVICLLDILNNWSSFTIIYNQLEIIH